jgi:hypothetical protein
LLLQAQPNFPDAKFQSNHHVILAIGYPLVTPHKWTKEEYPLLALQLKKTNLQNIKRLKNKLKHVEYDQKKNKSEAPTRHVQMHLYMYDNYIDTQFTDQANGHSVF